METPSDHTLHTKLHLTHNRVYYGIEVLVVLIITVYTQQFLLIQWVLGLASPGTGAGLHHIGVPVATIGSGVVYLQHVCRVDLVASHYASGAIRAVQTFIESVATGLAGWQALFDVRVGYYRQHPGAHFLAIILNKHTHTQYGT